MTGNIINNGTQAFEPIVDKLGAIATEFLPYMLYIAIACASVRLAYEAVRFIINYLKSKNKSTFYYERFNSEKSYWKNGTFHAQFDLVKRKKPKWKYFKYFR